MKSIWVMLPVLCHSFLLTAQSQFDISRLDINTKSKELAPALYKKDLVFCSDKRNDGIVTYTDQQNRSLTNLYVASHRKSGGFGKTELFSKELTTFMFEGPATFSNDGQVIYFTRTINVNNGKLNRERTDTTFGIFTAINNNGKWASIRAFPYNSNAYNTGYPCVSDDGRVMYFCSDAPEGMGGFDIYMSVREATGWGKPQNLGPAVNTSKNEVFPYIDKGGRLYFSSRGHNERGDLDIYYAAKSGDEWQTPVALSSPFNTTSDDFGLIFNSSSDTGYFVSDREGNADIFAVYSKIPAFSGCLPQQHNDYCYLFYESNNNEIDTTAFAYEWDLGDGTKVRSIKAEHCYARPDSYFIQLNIIDKLTADVLISQATYTVIAEPAEQPYITAPDTVYSDEPVLLNARETYLKNFNVTNYYWDFGDGSRSQGPEIRHTFVSPGIYQIVLGVTGNSTKSEPAATPPVCVTRQIIVLKEKR